MRDLFNFIEGNKIKLYDNLKIKDGDNVGSLP